MQENLQKISLTSIEKAPVTQLNIYIALPSLFLAVLLQSYEVTEELLGADLESFWKFEFLDGSFIVSLVPKSFYSAENEKRVTSYDIEVDFHLRAFSWM